MLHIERLIAEYREESGAVLRALSVPDFLLEDGNAAAVVGPSGSGKSTLFHCIAGLLRPAAGRITACGADITAADAAALSAWRKEKVGYIFQEARLLPYLTVMENILLAADIAGRRGAREQAEGWLSHVGLSGCGGRMPRELSGGERQRVSFVRAVIRGPALLLADEPTASLDADNAHLLMELLLAYQKENGTMLLCAAHDPSVQALFSKKLFLVKGGDAVCS